MYRRILIARCVAGLLVGLSPAGRGAAAEEGPEGPPATIELTGIVRDFRAVGLNGGHSDFENNPGNGMARYAGNLAPLIGENSKPVFTGNGAKITNQWRDAQNRQISHLLYEAFPLPGDVEGSFGQPGTGGITSAGTFAHWFRDVPVYNMSMPLTLTLFRQADGMYVFDDQMDPYYIERDGFFPVDDQLFGNSLSNGNGNGNGNDDHNFHFTFELHTRFQYDAALGQSFKFEGTDTVWLYIDGHLVNDLIGVHAAHDQYVAVDRLGLEDGEWYELDFFFAQRYMPQSHFRITTNLLLVSLELPTVSAVHD
ncbi:MAG: fibro-slime domain-containing protein [Planctomycetota bacterium]|jgi:fibro-slime domain-containing protein